MKHGWEYKAFEACIKKLPKVKQVKTEEYNSGTKYPIVSQEEKLISGFYDDESYVFHIDSPVIIFGDHTRVLKYVDFDFVVGADGVKIISPQKELNAKFLLYYLLWYKIPNLGYSRHYKLLKELKVPSPLLPTQLAIVSELDKINELIRLKKEQLNDFENLAQSIFYEMFGDPVENEKEWEVKKLGEVCKTTSGGTPSKSHQEYYTNGNIPWLRSGEVAQGFITTTEICITEEGLKNSSAKMIPIDSVAVAMYGATVGQVGIIKCPMCTNQAICSIFPNSHFDTIFLYYLLKTKKKYFLSLAGGGAQANISQGIIRETNIPLPPLPIQQLFAKRIERIELQKAEVQKTIANLETLLASRMQYWFE